MSIKTYRGKKLVSTETRTHKVYSAELYEYYFTKFLNLGFSVEATEAMIDSNPDYRLAANMLSKGATHTQVTNIIS